MKLRRFEIVEGTADKFWSIGVDGASVRVHYGRNGTNGQVKEKTYASAAAAQADAEKQIAAKVKKGYAEAGTAEASPAPAPAVEVSEASEVPETSTVEPTTIGVPAVEGLGLVITEVERAALDGPGGSLRSLRAPHARSAADTIAHWEQWLAEHSVVDATLGQIFLTAAPFDGLPDELSARWWAGYRLDNMCGRREDDQVWRPQPFSDPVWWASDRSVTQMRPTDLASRKRLARQAVEETGAAVPCFPSSPSNLRLDAPIRAGVNIVLDGAVTTALQAIAQGDLELVWALRAFIDIDAAEFSEVRARLRAALDDPGTKPWDWLAASTLSATPAEHADLVAGLDVANLGFRGVDFGALHCAAAGLDQPARDALWTKVADGVNRAERRTPYASRMSGEPTALDIHLFGSPALEAAIGYITEDSKAASADARTAVLAGHLTGVGAVPVMLRIAANSRAASRARAWLLEHAAELQAYDGVLTPVETSVAAEIVRELVAQGTDLQPAQLALAAVVADLHEETAMPVLGDDVAWWAEAVAAEAAAEVPESPITVSEPPSWIASLRSIRVDDANGPVRLSREQATQVLVSAATSIRDETLRPRPLVAAVRERMTGRARDAAAENILKAWLGSGAAHADRAYFAAAGFLGHDSFVATLTPLIRAWPGESQHKRSVLGLDALAATGTASALQAISGIANKSKFKGVQKAARESLERLAALAGLTAPELEDRVVPDAGLDDTGRRILDFGPRQFRVSLNPQGKAVVHALDADGSPVGKPRTSLPAPNSKDDPEQAAAAKAEFATLRKQLVEVAKIQTIRLEQAMVTGRIWTAADHAAYLARHPVMNGLIRPLVWEVIDLDRVLVHVSEDREYLTVDEVVVEPSSTAKVRLAHPVHLTESEKASWRGLLGDYDLEPPIEQLERAVYELPAGQGDDQSYAAGPAGELVATTFASTLERLGWERGTPLDAGVVVEMFLAFPDGVEVIAVLSGGLMSGDLRESPPQGISQLWAYRRDGDRPQYFANRRETTLPWSELDPVLVSELGRCCAILQQKMDQQVNA